MMKKDSKGFVLAFATMISSVILSIGLGIYSIAVRELTLSAAGRESQFAFYAADTGGECALFWDIRHPGFSNSVFPTSTESTVLPSGSGVFCNGEDITVKSTGWSTSAGWDVSGVTATAATIVFDMEFSNNSCASVTVIKSNGTTQIDSRGYNTCDGANPRRVERGLRVRY